MAVGLALRTLIVSRRGRQDEGRLLHTRAVVAARADDNHSTGLANSALIIQPALGPASSMAKWPSAAFRCRTPKLRKNIRALPIRIARFIIFKSSALPDLV